MTTPSFDDELRSIQFTLKADRRSPHTLRQYTDSLRRFATWVGDAHPEVERLTDVERFHIVHWLGDMQSHYAEATVRHSFSGLKACFTILEAEGFIQERESPFLKLKAPPVSETRKDVVSLPDLSRVLKSLDTAKSYRDAALVSLFADTGMRASEVAGIRVKDVDWEEQIITLPKTKNHEVREVPFGPTTAKRMDRWMRYRKDKLAAYLFTGVSKRYGPRPMTRSGMFQVIQKVFKDHGVDGSISPHDLRHTFATHFLEDENARTEDLATICGWNSEQMVRRYTKQRRTARAIAAHRRLSPVERLN